MQTYSDDMVCPKCGEVWPGLFWHPANDEGVCQAQPLGTFTPNPLEEHIDCTCARCGYCWAMLPLS